MKRLSALLLLLLLLFAGCAPRPQPLDKLLDGSPEAAACLAAFSQGLAKQDAPALGAAIPTYEYRDGGFVARAPEWPVYVDGALDFFLQLPEGEVRGSVNPVSWEMVMTLHERDLSAGGAALLYTADALYYYNEAGERLALANFRPDPPAGLASIADWDAVSPAAFTFSEAAEPQKLDYEPEFYAKYDPLADLRAVDGSWSCEAGANTRERVPLTADEQQALAGLLTSLPYLESSEKDQREGIYPSYFYLTDPQGRSWSLVRAGRLFWLHDPWGGSFQLDAPDAALAELDALWEGAFQPASAELTWGGSTVTVTDAETVQALQTWTDELWSGTMSGASPSLVSTATLDTPDASLTLYDRAGTQQKHLTAYLHDGIFTQQRSSRTLCYESADAVQALLALCSDYVEG